jgi:RraA family protein
VVKLIEQTPEVINAYNVTGEDSWVLEIAVIDVEHLDAVVTKFCILTETSTSIVLNAPRENAVVLPARREDINPSSRKSPENEHCRPRRPHCICHLRPLRPAQGRHLGRVQGAAAGVPELWRRRQIQRPGRHRQTVESPGEARVLVVDGGGSLRRALLGGNLGLSAAKNGWAGVVIDGCVRDAAELARCRTGIRALALMPLPTERRQEGQRDIPIQVQGVRIYPGDWLYADEDGIVVMPAPGQA